MRPLARLPAVIVAATLAASCAAPPAPVDVRRVDDGTIEFPAVVQAAGFVADGHPPGYHLIVWDGGGAAGGALLRARVTDVQVLDALEALGAEPGNALSIDTWDERHDPDSAAPARVIEGPPVRVEVLLPDGDALGLEELLRDPGGRGFEMRLGGHRANIPEWHSGCVVCLYSCPGSKVGNARYTLRDFVDGVTRFEARPGVLPPDGTEVTVRMSLQEATP